MDSRRCFSDGWLPLSFLSRNGGYRKIAADGTAASDFSERRAVLSVFKGSGVGGLDSPSSMFAFFRGGFSNASAGDFSERRQLFFRAVSDGKRLLDFSGRFAGFFASFSPVVGSSEVLERKTEAKRDVGSVSDFGEILTRSSFLYRAAESVGGGASFHRCFRAGLCTGRSRPFFLFGIFFAGRSARRTALWSCSRRLLTN